MVHKTEDVNLGCSISHSSEGWLQRGKGEPGYLRVSATKIRQSELEKLLLIKENQISQVREFSAFYVWENTRVWAHLSHFFDVHLSSLGPASCDSHTESPQGT